MASWAHNLLDHKTKQDKTKQKKKENKQNDLCHKHRGVHIQTEVVISGFDQVNFVTLDEVSAVRRRQILYY